MRYRAVLCPPISDPASTSDQPGSAAIAVRLEDGFCSRHQPDAPTISIPFFTPKKLAAFLIALAMLWPELTRFLSALARLLR